MYNSIKITVCTDSVPILFVLYNLFTMRLSSNARLIEKNREKRFTRRVNFYKELTTK